MLIAMGLSDLDETDWTFDSPEQEQTPSCELVNVEIEVTDKN